MPETRAVGSDGDVTLPSGHNIVTRAWTMNINQPVTDTTGFGDTWRRNRGGVYGGGGSISGVPEFDATSTAPGAAALSNTGGSGTLQVATGCTYGGTMIFSNFNAGSTQGGEATMSFDYVWDDTVTETWDETG